MKLEKIARQMEKRARATGRSVRTLPKGLVLDLAWVGGYKTLRLSREGGMPGDSEIQTCRAVFGVPAEAKAEKGFVSVTLRWRV